jgi:DNA primase
MNSSRDQIEEIKDRLDIVDIVEKYVHLKQAGKNFSGLCPFHSEKTSSFIVSPELQRYKCFGCGEAGDIFNFIQKIENIDFAEALEKLAKEAGIKLVKRENNTQYQRLEEINKRAAIYFFKQLKKFPIVLKYLHTRGLNDESIKEFGIGYSPGGFGLLDFIQKDTKYSKKELLSCGLFVLKDGKLRDKFFKRIMFPIRSSSGRVIAFTGRILPDNKYGPKYMNSPETPIYKKKYNLYGQYESRQQIRKDDLVIMCEGTTDVIASHQIGIKNIVAPLGTAITSEQLEKISKLTKNILFLFDSDLAGQQALEKAFILSQKFSLNTYAANTLPYKDIDEYIKNKPTGFKKLLKKKVDAYTYMLIKQIEGKDLTKFEEYQKAISWMSKILSYVKNPLLMAFYVKSGFNITKIRYPMKSKKFSSIKKIAQCGTHTPFNTDKEYLFAQELLFQEKISLPNYIKIDFFRNENIKQILSYIKENPNTKRQEVLEHFIDNLTVKEILEESIFSFSKEQSSDNELKELYHNIVVTYLKRKEEEYNIKIATAEQMGNLKEGDSLLKEFQTLTKERKKYEEDSRL